MQSWLDGLKAGEEQAYKRLVQVYYPKLVLWMRKFIQDEAQVEDAAQEILIKVWENRAKIASDGNLDALLYITAQHRSYDLLRRQKVKPGHGSLERDPFFWQEAEQSLLNGDSDDISWREEKEAKLKSLVAVLPTQQRRIVSLRLEENLSVVQISARMGLSKSTVKGQFARAVKNLARLFQQQ